MLFDVHGFSETFKKFTDGKIALNDVTMEVVGDVNDLNPVVLLRYYETDSSVESNTNLAMQLLADKEVRFFRKGKEIVRFIYRAGTDLGECFKAHPYLLDVCLKYCYGAMVKKLTAPLPDSETSTEQSESQNNDN